MKRFIPIVVVIAAVLSTLLYIELREQRLEAEGPSGGSATIEGIELDIVSGLPTRIVAIHVQEGDQVTVGQLLVELDCRDQEAMLLEAEAVIEAATAGTRVAEARITLAGHGVVAAERTTRAADGASDATRAQRSALEAQRDAARRAAERLAELHQSGGASDQELDLARTQAEVLDEQIRAARAGTRASEAQTSAIETGEDVARTQTSIAEAGLVAAQADLQRAQAARQRLLRMREECRLEAPRPGYVQTRAFEPGELVAPGSRLLTLVDTRVVTATFYLPNAELAAARPGQPVEIVADAYPDRTFSGAITHVSTSAEFTPRNVQTREDRDRLVYAVEVEVENPENQLRPGMPVEVTIPGSERNESTDHGTATD